MEASSSSLCVNRETGELCERKDLHRSAEKQVGIVCLLGILELAEDKYLVAATNRKKVATLQKFSIYQITKCKLFPLRHQKIPSKTEQQQLDMVETILQLPSLYYSFSFDITNTQHRLKTTITRESRFFWNNNIAQPFLTDSFKKWLTPVIFGFVGFCEGVEALGEKFDYLLISRRSRLNAGTRFWRRGVDYDGNAANTVETEQIVVNKGRITSFVQLRGSIPFVWSQKPNGKIVPPVVIKSKETCDDSAFRLHFYDVKEMYGEPLLVNLVKQRGSEKQLSQMYTTRAKEMNLNIISFDFHAMCSRTNFIKLKELEDQVIPFLKRTGFTIVDCGTLVSSQYGIVRTNCLDNLDRTNIVQTLFGTKVIVDMVKGTDAEPQESLENFPKFYFLMKNIWADHADVISQQYSGTGALNTLFTRTGKTNVRSAIRDKITSATRYYQNNFCDGYKQDAYDVFLGNFSPVEHPDWYHESPFSIITYVIFCFVALLLLSVFLYTKITFSMVIVVVAVVGLILLSILSYFLVIDKPQFG